MTAASQALGRHGEDLATRWYLDRGYELVARNWRCREGELDVVMRSDTALVFCEVKTRRSNRYGTPAEAVTAARCRRIRRAATAFLQQEASSPSTGPSPNVRFDVACVVDGKVEVIEGAF